MLSREEFIARHRVELEGVLLDAAVRQRAGGELSVFLRMCQDRVARRLGQIYDELARGGAPAKPAAPGRPATQTTAPPVTAGRIGQT